MQENNKITDMLLKKLDTKKPFLSLEYFPPKTDTGTHNLFARIEKMTRLNPLFADVTWGAGGSNKNSSSLDISEVISDYFRIPVLQHVTGRGETKESMSKILDKLISLKIKNVLLLRGDAPSSTQDNDSGDFAYAIDLVRFVREKYGDAFSIGVAGYPEGHFESGGVSECVQHLKRKVDAGADFVLTQIFFDANIFNQFIDRCRTAGIVCPILPGIMPIHAYQRFLKIAKSCNLAVPNNVAENLEKYKKNDALVKEYGINQCTEMCNRLIESGNYGLHFYTLNLQTSVEAVAQNLGLGSEKDRALPWSACTSQVRKKEEVRPIFWSNNPQSYLARTNDWDDFPNGRWGDSRSPTFGAMNRYYNLRGKTFNKAKKEEKRKEQWSNLKTEHDFFSLFGRFAAGEAEDFPWSTTGIHAETIDITPELIELNHKGLLTINSQPQVNGLRSSDPIFGWGGQDGYVYQKAYLEFFCSAKHLKTILSFAKNKKSVSLNAYSASGLQFEANNQESRVNAITWGVFYGKEIIQPTIVDKASFKIWKNEAFEKWDQEITPLFPEDSIGKAISEKIAAEYFLVNIVENDYVQGSLLQDLLEIL